jgi:hypothetical protein
MNYVHAFSYICMGQQKIKVHIFAAIGRTDMAHLHSHPSPTQPPKYTSANLETQNINFLTLLPSKTKRLKLERYWEFGIY